MNCNLILIISCIAIEIPVAGIAAYFLLKARKTTVTVVQAPSPVITPALAEATAPAAKPAQVSAPTLTVQTIVKCAKCGHFVARYTPTAEGPICANELPIV